MSFTAVAPSSCRAKTLVGFTDRKQKDLHILEVCKARLQHCTEPGASTCLTWHTPQLHASSCRSPPLHVRPVDQDQIAAYTTYVSAASC